MKYTILIYILLLLSGCVVIPSVESKAEKLNIKQECCLGYEDIKYKKISSISGESNRMSDQLVMRFGFNKSYFLAIDLETSKTIEVHSYSDSSLSSNQVYWPTIILLNEGLSEVRRINFKSSREATADNCTHFGFRDIFWGKRVELNDNERYMIIYTEFNPHHYESMSVYKSISNPCLPSSIWPPFDMSTYRAQSSPDGKINVIVR